MSTTGSARPNPPNDGSQELAARLRNELTRATEQVARTQAEYDGLLADPGVIQEDRDSVARLLELERRQMNSAKSALERFDAGSYGSCAKCGGKIGEERLAALVDVTTCVNCAG